MSTMNISLPDSLKDFVDKQVTERGYGTSSEYVRELIRKDADRLHLRGLLLEGASSVAAGPADSAYFDGFAEIGKRLAERERLEREKLVLQLENALLRFEKLLPPPADTKRLK